MSTALRLLHKKTAATAQKNGFFDKSIVPITDVNGLVHFKDEYIREQTTLEILSGLSPALKRWEICCLTKPQLINT
jgi:acetyl-CoA C-acetyltransferase